MRLGGPPPECPACLDKDVTVLLWAQYDEHGRRFKYYCHGCRHEWVVDEPRDPPPAAA